MPNYAAQFVDFIPERLEDGVLYISRQYGTAVHKCCCGCSEEVVTPLNPTDWSLQVGNNLVTLHPSVGNWSFSCRSHIWIRKNKVIWAAPMSKQMIQRSRAIDRATKQAYFDSVNRQKALHSQSSPITRRRTGAARQLVATTQSLAEMIVRFFLLVSP